MSEQTFNSELTRRAEDVHGAPLTFEQVRGRAHRIRRRRRAAASGAVAAVVAAAIVVPTVLTGGNGGSRPQPAPQPGAPGVSVLHDGVVTEPDGTTVRIDVDNEDVTDFGALADGRFVVALQQPYAVRVYAADGSLEHQYDVSVNVVTTSADGAAAAWLGKGQEVQVLASGSPEPTSMGRLPGPETQTIDAVLDPEHVLLGDGTATTGELTSAGFQELRLPQGKVVDVSPGGDLWAMQLIPVNDQQYGCGALYDPRADTVVARNCATPSGLTFSPDGRHVLGVTGENNMMVETTVLDLDLQPVDGFLPESEGVAVSRVGWADANHLVGGIVRLRTNQWSLVESGIDDNRPWPQTLVGPVAGGNPEMTSEFVLSD